MKSDSYLKTSDWPMIPWFLETFDSVNCIWQTPKLNLFLLFQSLLHSFYINGKVVKIIIIISMFDIYHFNLSTIEFFLLHQHECSFWDDIPILWPGRSSYNARIFCGFLFSHETLNERIIWPPEKKMRGTCGNSGYFWPRFHQEPEFWRETSQTSWYGQATLGSQDSL